MRPMSAGMGPVNLLPTRSRMRRKGREVMQEGMGPEMPFQSAIVRLERRVTSSLFSFLNDI